MIRVVYAIGGVLLGVGIANAFTTTTIPNGGVLTVVFSSALLIGTAIAEELNR